MKHRRSQRPAQGRGRLWRYLEPRPTKAQRKTMMEVIPTMADRKVNRETGEIETPVLHSYKGNRIKWDEPGQIAEGRISRKNYVAMRDDKLAIQYTLEGGPEGPTSFLAPVQVAEALDRVPFGTYVRIIYKSEEKGGKYGRYKDFDIQGEEVVLLPDPKSFDDVGPEGGQ